MDTKISAREYRQLLHVGYVPVATWVDDDDLDYCRKWKWKTSEVRPVAIHVKLARGYDRVRVNVRDQYAIEDLELVPKNVKEDIPEDADEEEVRDLLPEGHDAQHYTRIAAILGIAPFSNGSPGFGDTVKMSHEYRLAGLDIEVTTSMRQGNFPLPTDPIISIAISCSTGSNYLGYTVGKVNRRKMEGAICVKHSNSADLVEWAIVTLMIEDPDYVVIHNGYKFDVPCMAVHAPVALAEFFKRVRLGSTDKGVTLSIPGINVLDTCFYLGKVHRSDYPGMSLNVIATHLGLPAKLDAPPMSVDPGNESYDFTKMGLYNIHDAWLHWKLAVACKCLEEIANLCNFSKSPALDVLRYITGTMVTQAMVSHQLHEGRIIDWSPSPKSTSKYPGAFVLEPRTGIHHHVKGYDFASLYPSIMNASNISQETVEVLEEEKSHLIAGAVDWGESKVKIAITGCTASFDTRVEGVTKGTMLQLISRRKQVGKQTMQGWALKVLANSLYGAFGARTATLYFRECAESVTTVGRWLITSLSSIIQGVLKAEVLYGDTDSVFVGNRDNIRGIPITSDKFDDTLLTIYRRIMSFTPFGEIGLEPDDHEYVSLILIKKKHYAGLLPGGKLKEKGMATVRKSTCQFVRDFCREFTMRLLETEGHRVLLGEVVDRYRGRLTKKDYKIAELCSEVKVDGVPCYRFKASNGVYVTADPADIEQVTEPPDHGYVWERMSGSVASMCAVAGLPRLELLAREFSDYCLRYKQSAMRA